MDVFESAKQHFIAGLHRLGTNELQAAEQQFTRSLELMPDRVSTLNNLAGVKIRLKKFAEAEQFARKAVAIEDSSPEAWSNLAIALTKTERHDEALRACERALDCDPTNAKSWLNKAGLRSLARSWP